MTSYNACLSHFTQRNVLSAHPYCCNGNNKAEWYFIYLDNQQIPQFLYPFIHRPDTRFVSTLWLVWIMLTAWRRVVRFSPSQADASTLWAQTCHHPRPAVHLLTPGSCALSIHSPVSALCSAASCSCSWSETVSPLKTSFPTSSCSFRLFRDKPMYFLYRFSYQFLIHQLHTMFTCAFPTIHILCFLKNLPRWLAALQPHLETPFSRGQAALVLMDQDHIPMFIGMSGWTWGYFFQISVHFLKTDLSRIHKMGECFP